MQFFFNIYTLSSVMRIRKITCRGFKTYRDITVVDQLDSKMNCIVGMNGSGKSSIFHAINFILSPKTNSAAFLHEGSMGKSLSGFVEIEFFENDDLLVLKRTVSTVKDEFAINSKSVTRAEYISYLQTTASLLGSKAPYYIVEQGRVAGMVSDKMRYDLLKEAVGVDVFDEKKTEAISLLEEASKKEQRLEELVLEINQKCDSLERDCVEMTEYASLREDKDLVEYQLANAELDELKQMQVKIESNMALEKEKILNCESEITSLWETSTTLGIETDRIDDELDRAGVVKLREKLNHSIANVAMSKEKISAEETEARKISDSLKQVHSGLEELESKKKGIELVVKSDQAELHSLNQKMAETAKEKRDLQSDFVKISESLVSVEVNEQRVSELDLVSKSLLRKNAMIKIDIQEKDLELARIIREQIPQTFEKIEKAKEELSREEEKEFEFQNRNSRVSNEISIHKTALFKAKQKEFETRREIDQVGRELIAANSQVMKNTNGNTREVKKVSGVVGFLGDFLTIPSIYRKAVESVGKNILFNVLIESDSVADQVVKALKMKGKVTLVPLNRVDATPGQVQSSLIASLAKDGIEACLLSSVIKVNDCEEINEEKVQFLINRSFSRTVLVESLETGMLVARKYNVDTVTLDGDQVTKDLIVRGGGSVYQGSIVRNWQFALDLKSKLGASKSRLRTVQAEIVEIESKLAQAESDLTTVPVYSDNMYVLRESLSSLEREYKYLEERKDRIQKIELINLVESDLKNNEMDLRKSELDKLEISELVKKVRAGALIGTISPEEKLEQETVLTASLANVDSLLVEIELEMSKLQKRIAAQTSELAFFIESRETHLTELGREKERFLAFSVGKIARLNEELVELEFGKESLQTELDSVRAKCEEMEKNRSEFKKKMDEINEEISKMEMRKSDSKLKSMETRIHNLKAEIASATISMHRHHSGGTECLLGKSIRELRQTVISLNKELSAPRFELVNKKSIEQYERVKKDRAEFLKGKADVFESREEISSLMNVLVEKEKKIISDSIEKLQASFNALFGQVTSGGSVYITRKDSDSLSLEVAFPHVAKKRLGELSGGQRTVVSLCFLLSLARIGSLGGFFVLDEVDAALDDKFREGIAMAMGLIADEGHQCFFTSFRPEFCKVSKRHFLVTMQGGTSRIALATREAALQFVSHDEGNLMDASKSVLMDQSDTLMYHGA